MFKKYAILIGIIIALLLLAVAMLYYPGGSQYNKNSIGYDLKNNYLSNLFGEKAVNGAANTARPWSAAGMLFLSVSFALFFIEFSKKIPQKGASNIIRYFGAGAMIFAFLAITPLHDIMVTIACTIAPVSMFYITVFVFRSKLHLFKILSVACLLIFYTCSYCYYTYSYIEFLPILQKAALIISTTWVLCLQYLTTATDFQSQKT
jgi:hypothetical protein